MALESDIDIFKYFFLPMRKPEQKHTFRQVALQRGPFLFLSLEDSKVEFWFSMCVSSMLAFNLFVCISIFSDRSFLHVFMSIFLGLYV